MKIYFAGIPAGYRGFISWEETERILHEEMNIDNRLCSYHFMDVLNGYMRFIKNYEGLLYQERYHSNKKDSER